MSVQEMLEEAIELFGPNDIVTIMLSQKRDEEVNKEQLEASKGYKEASYVSIVYN